MNKRYVEVKFVVGTTVKEAVEELLSYRDKGILACGKFNEITLYSDTVTMDGAYKTITGKTKVEFDKSQQEWKENYKKERREHEEKIPELTLEWQKKGREILTEDRWAYWDKIVPIRLNDIYRGMELGSCLDIVKILNNNGTLDEAKEKIVSQGHSGTSFGLVCSMVKEFCLRGNEFANYVR